MRLIRIDGQCQTAIDSSLNALRLLTISPTDENHFILSKIFKTKSAKAISKFYKVIFSANYF